MTEFLIQYEIWRQGSHTTTSWYRTWSFNTHGAAQAARQEARRQYGVSGNDVVILRIKETA